MFKNMKTPKCFECKNPMVKQGYKFFVCIEYVTREFCVKEIKGLVGSIGC